MGKLEGKVAVITGGSSGMALASAKRFVEEGAYVFITGRRQEQLDEAVKLIGRNVTGVRGDAANLDDLDRLFDTVKREKGKIDVLFASAGMGEAVPLGEITEQHFDADLRPEYARNAVYGSEGVAAVQRWRIDLHDRVSCFGERFSWFRRVCGEQGGVALIRTHLAQRTEGQEYPGERAEPGADRHTDAGPSSHEEAKQMFESLIPRGKMGHPEEIATAALFLASDDSSFVNGVELAVDGGFSAI